MKVVSFHTHAGPAVVAGAPLGGAVMNGRCKKPPAVALVVIAVPGPITVSTEAPIWIRVAGVHAMFATKLFPVQPVTIVSVELGIVRRSDSMQP